MTKRNSYKHCHCGANCCFLGYDDNRPCWGEVFPYGLSGDDDFNHACKGHMPILYGEKYEHEKSQEENQKTINSRNSTK